MKLSCAGRSRWCTRCPMQSALLRSCATNWCAFSTLASRRSGRTPSAETMLGCWADRTRPASGWRCATEWLPRRRSGKAARGRHAAQVPFEHEEGDACADPEPHGRTQDVQTKHFRQIECYVSGAGLFARISDCSAGLRLQRMLRLGFLTSRRPRPASHRHHHATSPATKALAQAHWKL